LRKVESATIAAMPSRCGTLVVLLFATAVPVGAAEHPAVAQARALYNMADFAGAIDAAAVALGDSASAPGASLVMARAHLERYRITLNPTDLSSARAALGAIRVAQLKPRDQLDLLVGLGQALYLGETFGAAAELFDVALSRRSELDERDQLKLLDWWATATDREAWKRPADQRIVLLDKVYERVAEEVRRDPGNPVANFWLAASARGMGDLSRAWDAAIAAWVRAPLRAETALVLRADIDRLVTEVLVPELARARSGADTTEAVATELLADWNALKAQWR
jgi:hypothetical protein